MASQRDEHGAPGEEAPAVPPGTPGEEAPASSPALREGPALSALRAAARARHNQPAPDVPWARTPPARAARVAVQRGLLLPVLRFLAPVHVIGRGNLRRLRGPAVFVANHTSHFDAPVCLAALGGRIRRRLVIAAAADYFYKSKVVGAAVSVALGTMPFIRSGGSTRGSIEVLKKLVKEGWSVLIFPSGSRGAVSGFKRGFAYVAIDAGVPVVPLYLHGLEDVMPKGARIPLPGGVVVGVGAPIPPGDDYGALVRKAETSLAELQALVLRWEAA